MRKQIKLTFQIGFQSSAHGLEATAAFERYIARGLSRVCGGCTTDYRKGWWAEEGAKRAERFEGKIHREDCLTVELTCEPHKVEAAYQAARDIITREAFEYGIETEWVHVSEVEMTGRHFSVATHGAAMANAAA